MSVFLLRLFLDYLNIYLNTSRCSTWIIYLNWRLRKARWQFSSYNYFLIIVYFNLSLSHTRNYISVPKSTNSYMYRGLQIQIHNDGTTKQRRRKKFWLLIPYLRGWYITTPKVSMLININSTFFFVSSLFLIIFFFFFSSFVPCSKIFSHVFILRWKI